jgi:hypothetical protein
LSTYYGEKLAHQIQSGFNWSQTDLDFSKAGNFRSEARHPGDSGRPMAGNLHSNMGTGSHNMH